MNGFNLRLLSLEDRCTPATLTGTAFHDANFNGTLDGGEAILANVDVMLNLNGKGTTVLTAKTSTSGVYSFNGVANGTHTLSAALEGFSKVTANPVGVVLNTTGTVTVNLGFVPANVVSGFAFSDMDGDNSLDPGERLLPNYSITLDLDGNGGVDATTFTDSNGVFRFSGIANGTHKIAIPNATTNPEFRSVVVSNADVSGLGFAVTPTGALSGITYSDANANGVQDGTETGLASVTVNFDFFNDGSVDKSIVTAAEGKYSFTGIPDGTHRITAQRTGYVNTSPAQFVNTWLIGHLVPPPVPQIINVPRTPGDPVGYPSQVPTEFGLAQTAIVSGFVYGDLDGDGSPDSGETEIEGVVVRLDTDSNGSFDRSTTTDKFGRFAFVNVPNGTHSLAASLKNGYTADALTKSFTITGGTSSTGNAFALRPLAPVSVIAVSAESQEMNIVKVFRYNGEHVSDFEPFTTDGASRVATGDVNGDGIEDFAVATSAGRSTLVRVLDGNDRTQLFSIAPYGSGFTGGAFVALGDITGDKRADLVITPDITGGPRVRIFSGDGFAQIADFFGIDDVDFRGGARAAIGDLNGDSRGDLVVSAGFGGGPRVALFDGMQLQLSGGPKFIGDFFAFEPDLRNGAYVAIGDTNGDGFGDLIAGAGSGGAPRITVYSGKALVNDEKVRFADFFAGGQTADRSGVKVTVADVDSDGLADIVAGYRPLPTFVPRLAAYSGAGLSPSANPAEVFDMEPFPGFLGGISVG